MRKQTTAEAFEDLRIAIDGLIAILKAELLKLLKRFL